MKKTVLTYGLISGVIAAVLMLAHVPFMDGGSKSLIVGYTGIVLASLLIFFGVRSYREKVGNGKISFGRAFAVGILIALISSACYVAAWEVVYFSNPGIADHIFDKQVDDLKASGAAQEKIDEKTREVEAFKKLYANPFVNVLTPQRGAFLIGLALGERAAQSAEAGSLPPLALEALLAAPKYAEGRGIRLSVTSDAELEAAQALIPYKLAAAPSRASRKSVAKPRRA